MGDPHFTYTNVQPFCLQPPDRLPSPLSAMFQREGLRASAPVHSWLLGTLGALWASPFPSRLANRVWPNRVRRYPTDRLFTSRCSPPRLAATQLRSVTCGYMPARLGRSPGCLCALVGARGTALRAVAAVSVLGQVHAWRKEHRKRPSTHGHRTYLFISGTQH